MNLELCAESSAVVPVGTGPILRSCWESKAGWALGGGDPPLPTMYLHMLIKDSRDSQIGNSVAMIVAISPQMSESTTQKVKYPAGTDCTVKSAQRHPAMHRQNVVKTRQCHAFQMPPKPFSVATVLHNLCNKIAHSVPCCACYASSCTVT